METTDILFALLRHAVCGQELDEETKKACTPENLEAVYTLAKKHDLAHLVAFAVEGLDVPACEVLTKLKNVKMRAIYRYARMDLEFERLCQTLEDVQIPFIPLKGSVLRQYYPQPWMRTSCDIDVLVQPENLHRAVMLLEEKLCYRRHGKGPHDISMMSAGGIHVELHYDLIEEADSSQARKILENIWEQCSPKAEFACYYQMPWELFYFYHVAHMAKHFLHGGCGIRPFLDIWVMENRVKHDGSQRYNLLRQGGLLAFAHGSEKLAACWFGDASWDVDTEQFAAGVLCGGTYGTVSNRLSIERASGKKEKLPLHRFLIPYEDLKYYYPILEKKRWLTPICQILRWFRLLASIKKRAGNRLRGNHVLFQQEGNMQQLLRYLELQ